MQVNEQTIVDSITKLLEGIAKPGSLIVSFEVDRGAGKIELTQINGLVVVYTPGDFVEVVA